MRTQFNFLKALVIFILIGCSAVFAQAQAKRQVDPAVAKLGKGFVSNTGGSMKSAQYRRWTWFLSQIRREVMYE